MKSLLFKLLLILGITCLTSNVFSLSDSILEKKLKGTWVHKIDKNQEVVLDFEPDDKQINDNSNNNYRSVSKYGYQHDIRVTKHKHAVNKIKPINTIVMTQVVNNVTTQAKGQYKIVDGYLKITFNMTPLGYDGDYTYSIDSLGQIKLIITNLETGNQSEFRKLQKTTFIKNL